MNPWTSLYSPPKQRRPPKDKDTALINLKTEKAIDDLHLCDTLADFMALEHSSFGTPAYYRANLATIREPDPGTE